MPNRDHSTSESRLNANRQNAQHSTGPKTEEGKLVSSKNAVKTALTGRTVLLPTDDANRYQAHVKAFFDEIAPEGQRETLLTQSLADIAWRLERITNYEMAIYAVDRVFYAETYKDEPEPIRAQLVELAIFRSNERELRNLHIQEARLRRQRERDNDELHYLQAERRALKEQRLALAAYAYQQAKKEEKPYDPTQFGFVFSTEEIERFLFLKKAEKTIAAESTAVPSHTRPNSKRR
jgi:hypothetical protein